MANAIDPTILSQMSGWKVSADAEAATIVAALETENDPPKLQAHGDVLSISEYTRILLQYCDKLEAAQVADPVVQSDIDEAKVEVDVAMARYDLVSTRIQAVIATDWNTMPASPYLLP